MKEFSRNTLKNQWPEWMRCFSKYLQFSSSYAIHHITRLLFHACRIQNVESTAACPSFGDWRDSPCRFDRNLVCKSIFPSWRPWGKRNPWNICHGRFRSNFLNKSCCRQCIGSFVFLGIEFWFLQCNVGVFLGNEELGPLHHLWYLVSLNIWNYAMP